MAKEIIVEATPSGDVTISVNGVKGKSCKELTKKLEAALGKVAKVETTKEYFEKPSKAAHTVNQR